jgi:molecular chaperone HtpG
MLEDVAENQKDTYAEFWKQFGNVLKEGIGEDHANKERLAKLFRFASTHADEGVSLTDYVSRMPEGQKEIYYLLAPSRESGESSPYFEVFREKNFEVLFLTDPRDEFVMEHLREFDKKRVIAAEKADLTLDDKEHALSEDDARLLAHARARAPGARLLTFGEAAGADVRLTGYQVVGPVGADLHVDALGQPRRQPHHNRRVVQQRHGLPDRRLRAVPRTRSGDAAG